MTTNFNNLTSEEKKEIALQTKENAIIHEYCLTMNNKTIIGTPSYTPPSLPIVHPIGISELELVKMENYISITTSNMDRVETLLKGWTIKVINIKDPNIRMEELCVLFRKLERAGVGTEQLIIQNLPNIKKDCVNRMCYWINSMTTLKSLYMRNICTDPDDITVALTILTFNPSLEKLVWMGSSFHFEKWIKLHGLFSHTKITEFHIPDLDLEQNQVLSKLAVVNHCKNRNPVFKTNYYNLKHGCVLFAAHTFRNAHASYLKSIEFFANRVDDNHLTKLVWALKEVGAELEEFTFACSSTLTDLRSVELWHMLNFPLKTLSLHHVGMTEVGIFNMLDRIIISKTKNTLETLCMDFNVCNPAFLMKKLDILIKETRVKRIVVYNSKLPESHMIQLERWINAPRDGME